MVIGAAVAGYGLSKLIEKIPGWNSTLESLGGTAEKVAEKLGLIGGGAAKAGSPGSGAFTGAQFAKNQDALANAYQKALTLPGFARDAFVQNAVGKAYDFQDAKIAAEHLGKAIVTRADTLIDETLRRSAELAAQHVSSVHIGPSADSAQALALAEALGTKSTSDEEAIYKQRVDFINGEIARLKKNQTLTTAQAKQLAGLYTERTKYQAEIDGIDQANASAAQSAAAKAKALHDKEVAARKAELAAANQAYRSDLSIAEQKLQIQVERAQLTGKNLADDRKADLALLAFYRKESHDMKLTEAERLQYQSQAIQTQLTLKSLKATKAGATGATLNDIFGEAAAEFGSFGSNIGGRNAPLSGQDERAKFSQILLDRRHKQSEQAAAIRHVAAQSEASKQTGYLARIAQALAPVGTKARPPAPKAKTARTLSRIPR